MVYVGPMATIPHAYIMVLHCGVVDRHASLSISNDSWHQSEAKSPDVVTQTVFDTDRKKAGHDEAFDLVISMASHFNGAAAAASNLVDETRLLDILRHSRSHTHA